MTRREIHHDGKMRLSKQGIFGMQNRLIKQDSSRRAYQDSMILKAL